jgi:capsular polysaccharide transport system permease protein
MPRDITQASFAFGASILLGLGMGIINAIVAMAFVGWMTGYALIIVSLYLSSGVMFVPDSLPEVAPELQSRSSSDRMDAVSLL